MSLSSMKVVVHFMLPPPLILTILLVTPMPRMVNRALLAFAKNVLFCPVMGRVALVNVMLVLTGMMVIGSAIHTHQLRQAVELGQTPNKHMAQMARIWREERNFWISVLTFLLWGLLYRFYNLLIEYNSLKEKVQKLELPDKGGSAPSSSQHKPGVPAPKPQPPSAPPALGSHDNEARQRAGKAKVV